MPNASAWTTALTSLLRQSAPTLWANWTLDSTIRPGAIGTLDPVSGAFAYLTILPTPKVTEQPASQDWQFDSPTTNKSSSQVTFSSPLHDPTTNTDITAGTQTTWNFAAAYSIASAFTVVRRASLDDSGHQIEGNLAFLRAAAASVGKGAGDRIVQGFGVVTSVLDASSGLNVGALTAGSNFSLEGSAEGMALMQGDQTVKAGLMGSYINANESAPIDLHIWPSKAGIVAPEPMAIAYEFASFDGSTLLPGWTGVMDGMSIGIDNAHGGTYIVDAYLTCTSPSGSQSTISALGTAGGQMTSLNNIPLDSVHLKLVLDFRTLSAPEVHTVSWDNPLSLFTAGKWNIDTGGVWVPWGNYSTAVVRETGQSF